MKIGQYCQRHRCKHVELEQFLAYFRVARVCQRQLGFLVNKEEEDDDDDDDYLWLYRSASAETTRLRVIFTTICKHLFDLSVLTLQQLRRHLCAANIS